MAHVGLGGRGALAGAGTAGGRRAHRTPIHCSTRKWDRASDAKPWGEV